MRLHERRRTAGLYSARSPLSLAAAVGLVRDRGRLDFDAPIPRCVPDRLVAFSCKGRGFCPSCAGRRTAERTADLVDDVFPPVPVRQWVISFPPRVRYLLAWDHELRRAVVAALNFNAHVHALVVDGVFARSTSSRQVFHPARAPETGELSALVAAIVRRLERLCRYALRPPIADERLRMTSDGNAMLELRHLGLPDEIPPPAPARAPPDFFETQDAGHQKVDLCPKQDWLEPC